MRFERKLQAGRAIAARAGLANGSIASLVTGGWMGVDLETGVPSGKGDWRVAPLPEWTTGTAATSENGGSADSVLASSKNQLAAAGFLQFMNTGPGMQISANSGDFPSSLAMLAAMVNVPPRGIAREALTARLSRAV